MAKWKDGKAQSQIEDADNTIIDEDDVDGSQGSTSSGETTVGVIGSKTPVVKDPLSNSFSVAVSDDEKKTASDTAKRYKDLFERNDGSEIPTAIVTFYPNVWLESKGALDPFVWHTSEKTLPPSEIVEAILKVYTSEIVAGEKDEKLKRLFAQGLSKYLKTDPSEVQQLLMDPRKLEDFVTTAYSNSRNDGFIGAMVVDKDASANHDLKSAFNPEVAKKTLIPGADIHHDDEPNVESTERDKKDTPDKVDEKQVMPKDDAVKAYFDKLM